MPVPLQFSSNPVLRDAKLRLATPQRRFSAVRPGGVPLGRGRAAGDVSDMGMAGLRSSNEHVKTRNGHINDHDF